MEWLGSGSEDDDDEDEEDGDDDDDEDGMETDWYHPAGATSSKKFMQNLFFYSFWNFFQSSVDWPRVNEELDQIQISCGRPSVIGRGVGQEQLEKLSVAVNKKQQRREEFLFFPNISLNRTFEKNPKKR